MGDLVVSPFASTRIPLFHRLLIMKRNVKGGQCFVEPPRGEANFGRMSHSLPRPLGRSHSNIVTQPSKHPRGSGPSRPLLQRSHPTSVLTLGPIAPAMGTHFFISRARSVKEVRGARCFLTVRNISRALGRARSHDLQKFYVITE